jgi:branched-subunit amino acid aminotransferase/4-amino-4-deoxychorismate lyase
MIALDPTDRGLLLGDGLFETLLALEGKVQRPLVHLARMGRGCAALGLPAPDQDQALTVMAEALARSGLTHGRAAVRLNWTAGSGGRGLNRPLTLEPRLWASAAASLRPEHPARLMLANVRRNATSVTAHHKTLAYLDNVMARREALAVGADEAVMLNQDGDLACAAASNLFWIEGEQLFTPDLSCGVLAGTERARVLAAAAEARVEARLVQSSAEALQKADGIFLTNSLNGLWPVSHWQGTAVKTSPDAQRLMTVLGGS